MHSIGKKIAVFSIVFLSIFLSAQIFSVQVFARCGTYYPNQPFESNCSDAATGETFAARVVCTQNTQVCCESTSQCNEAFGEDDPFGDDDLFGGATNDEDINPVVDEELEPEPVVVEADFQQDQTVGCGSYFSTQPDPTARCVNAEEAGTPAINPYVVCGNGVSCCPTADMCPVPPPQPEPEEDEISSESCGSLFQDGTCRDFDSKIVQGAQQCRSSDDVERIESQCCTSIDLCDERPVVEVEGDEDERIVDYSYCLQVPAGTQRDNCEQCIGQGEEGSRVYTAVGCIRTGGSGLTEDLIRLLMGVSGGVALLSILAGAFLTTVSQNDSTKLKEAKGLITAAVSGLFFIVFSIFILQFFGVQILRIPGLGSANNTGAVQNAGGNGGRNPVAGGGVPEEIEEPVAPEQPIVQEWTPNDVQWRMSIMSGDPNFLEVCVQYPQDGAESNVVSVQGTPFYNENAYPFFTWSLSPPQSGANETYFSCGSIQMVSYASDFAESVYSSRENSISGQQFDGILQENGAFDYQVYLYLSGNGTGSPTDVQYADREAFVTDFAAANPNLRVEVAVNGEVYHTSHIAFVMSGG